MLTSLTFREKSLGIQIVAIALVYGYFGAHYWGQPLTGPRAMVALMSVTIAMIAIIVTSYIVIIARHRPEQLDERDRLVELRGSRNAYITSTAMIWCVLMLAIVQTSPGHLFFALMCACALAELVRLGSQLVYYRRGV